MYIYTYIYMCVSIYIYVYCKWQLHQLMKWMAAQRQISCKMNKLVPPRDQSVPAPLRSHQQLFSRCQLRSALVTDVWHRYRLGSNPSYWENCKDALVLQGRPCYQHTMAQRAYEPTLPAPMLAWANTPCKTDTRTERCLSSWALECANHTPKISFFLKVKGRFIENRLYQVKLQVR